MYILIILSRHTEGLVQPHPSINQTNQERKLRANFLDKEPKSA